MALYQVVEKETFGTDWSLVRYDAYAMQKFDNEADAKVAAMRYLTQINCENSLTKDEKLNSVEAFMMTEKGCFLGTLDQKPWYMTYPKDIKGKDAGVKYAKGDIVSDTKFFMLEGKTEVKVRPVPGT